MFHVLSVGELLSNSSWPRRSTVPFHSASELGCTWYARETSDAHRFRWPLVVPEDLDEEPGADDGEQHVDDRVADQNGGE